MRCSAQRCTADPGPLRAGTVPGPQRVIACRAAPGTGGCPMTTPRTIPPDVRRVQVEAADPDVSAFVSANAGSGKTYVLAQRVINLLLRGDIGLERELVQQPRAEGVDGLH